MGSQASTVPAARPGTATDVLRGVLLAHAEQMVALLVEDECTRFLAHAEQQRDDHGRHSLVRNGLQPERTIRTCIGPVRVRLPKFRSRTGAHVEFRSMFVPRFARSAAEPQPGAAWRYLDAVIRGDIHAALTATMGSHGEHASLLVPDPTSNDWSDRCARLLGDALDAQQWTRLWALAVQVRAAPALRGRDILVVLGEDASGRARLLCANPDDGGKEPWMRVTRGLRVRGLKAPLDASAVTGCAPGLIETLQGHCARPTGRDGAIAWASGFGDSNRNLGFFAGAGARVPLRRPGTWISALAVAPVFGVACESEAISGSGGQSEFGQYAKRKQRN